MPSGTNPVSSLQLENIGIIILGPFKLVHAQETKEELPAQKKSQKSYFIIRSGVCN